MEIERVARSSVESAVDGTFRKEPVPFSRRIPVRGANERVK